MKILIIDDEPSVSEFFCQLARDRGYEEVDVAASGEEAVTYVLRQVYDLITVDIKMPGVSGLEIIGMLRNMCPHAIIAVISGYLPEKISREVAGCVDVLIAKPVSIDTFGQLLQGADQVSQAVQKVRDLGISPEVD